MGSRWFGVAGVGIVVGRGLLWVVCGWCMWLLVAVVIASVRSWVLAIKALSSLGGQGYLRRYGDGVVIGQSVVVVVGSVVGVVIVGLRENERHTL